MVRLLLNENFPQPSVDALREQGHDALWIRDRHAGITDIAVMEMAVRDQRWIVTFDRDYGELVFNRRLPPPPAIILLREPHYRPAEPAGWLCDLLRDQERFQGQFVVLTRDSIRSRPLLQAV
jgi:predicted nuclease of predicted toxin-antitoxin system